MLFRPRPLGELFVLALFGLSCNNMKGINYDQQNKDNRDHWPVIEQQINIAKDDIVRNEYRKA